MFGGGGGGEGVVRQADEISKIVYRLSVKVCCRGVCNDTEDMYADGRSKTCAINCTYLHVAKIGRRAPARPPLHAARGSRLAARSSHIIYLLLVVRLRHSCLDSMLLSRHRPSIIHSHSSLS
jgi:hypothetical protein